MTKRPETVPLEGERKSPLTTSNNAAQQAITLFSDAKHANIAGRDGASDETEADAEPGKRVWVSSGCQDSESSHTTRTLSHSEAEEAEGDRAVSLSMRVMEN